MAAEYIAMVSEVTGERKRVVEWEIPYAQGLQFQNVYMEIHGHTMDDGPVPIDNVRSVIQTDVQSRS